MEEGGNSQHVADLRQKLAEHLDIANDKLTHMGKYASARCYGEREIPGATLAGILRPKRELDAMVGMRDDDGNILLTTEDIANHFRAFYKKLYTSQSTSSTEAIEDYLSYIKIPWLVVEHREHLMAPLTSDEIREALKGMASGKVPGSDGLTIAFYKEF